MRLAIQHGYGATAEGERIGRADDEAEARSLVVLSQSCLRRDVLDGGHLATATRTLLRRGKTPEFDFAKVNRFTR